MNDMEHQKSRATPDFNKKKNDKQQTIKDVIKNVSIPNSYGSNYKESKLEQFLRDDELD